MTSRRVLLAGGGHSHVEVLRYFALHRDNAAAITLVSPLPMMPYSGMMPGVVAGHYTSDESHIALDALSAWTGARFVCDRVAGIDLGARIARLASGDRVAFDIVSLDIGSTPDVTVAGAADHAICVKPFERFFDAWSIMQNDAAEAAVRTIGVVGGGAGGVEMLLAMQHRLQRTLGAAAPSFSLITDQPQILQQHSAWVRSRLRRVLEKRGVGLHLGNGATAVEPGALIVSGGRRMMFDRIVWATGAAAQPWVAASGLACDHSGFVIVDQHLRSSSHPFVFATGDCATQRGHPRPKAGVFAVKQGPPLAHNLARAVKGAPLVTYTPQRRALALITTGDRCAIASWGPVALAGGWVWKWKDHIDRRFVARYRSPAMAPAAAPAAATEKSTG